MQPEAVGLRKIGLEGMENQGWPGGPPSSAVLDSVAQCSGLAATPRKGRPSLCRGPRRRSSSPARSTRARFRWAGTAFEAPPRPSQRACSARLVAWWPSSATMRSAMVHDPGSGGPVQWSTAAALALASLVAYRPSAPSRAGNTASDAVWRPTTIAARLPHTDDKHWARPRSRRPAGHAPRLAFDALRSPGALVSIVAGPASGTPGATSRAAGSGLQGPGARLQGGGRAMHAL